MKKSILKHSIVYLLFLGFSLPFCSYAQKSDSIFMYQNLFGYILKMEDQKIKSKKIFNLLKMNENSKPYIIKYKVQSYVGCISFIGGSLWYFSKANDPYGNFDWRFMNRNEKIGYISSILLTTGGSYLFFSAKKYIKKAVKVYNKNLLPVKF